MTRQQALAKAVKLWGKTAQIRAEGDITSPEGRQEAVAERDRIKDLIAGVKAEIEERERAAGIPELRRQIVELNKHREQAQSIALTYKFTVGYIAMGVLFHVEGQGDTWEEAFAKAEKSRVVV